MAQKQKEVKITAYLHISATSGRVVCESKGKRNEYHGIRIPIGLDTMTRVCVRACAHAHYALTKPGRAPSCWLLKC